MFLLEVWISLLVTELTNLKAKFSLGVLNNDPFGLKISLPVAGTTWD